jgi:AcrR family transcriptional regulator
MSGNSQSSARAGILEAADVLFGERGFDGTSTREIAESCGVNKALIHYHFAGKDDLFRAVLDRYYERLDAALQNALASANGGRERLHRVVDVYVDFLAANRNFSRMVQREAAGGKHLDRIVARMAPIFARGIEVLSRDFPATTAGELSGPQLLLSFYGIVVSYFTYAPVLEALLKESPLTEPNITRRKRHLRRMLDLVADALEAEAAAAAKPARRKAGRGSRR